MGGYISSFLCNFVGLVYPAYSSFKALESPQTDDDKQWLTYWVVFAIFSTFETIGDSFLFWFPFYYEIKLLALVLLQIPHLKLAATLYTNSVQPFFKQREGAIDSFVSESAKVIQDKASTAAKDGVLFLAAKASPETISKVVTNVMSSHSDEKKNTATKTD
eukprot:TRINITY_DN1116_c0_g1_i1.p1 TRINITY_DN1116_c0_g1~~TRINITY_DN1116_c0_g1_i1.p1  ORF type:complete len:161 (-),score=25.71 TRINITY_DN1116_c0_g1_i1:27-509(-)